MNQVQVGLLIAIGATATGFLYVWWRTARRFRTVGNRRRPSATEIAIGAGTAFFDTLGIGSFATTTAIYRLRHLVSDERIPGTLNVGHAPTSLAQACIFIGAVQVQPALLLSMILAAAVGSWLGAGIVLKLDRKRIQVGMSAALIVAAVLFSLVNLALLPGGGDALGLSAEKFAIAVAANTIFGALMPLGIGLFAPCMITLALLGMNPIVAFPIMMGSCAFCQPVGCLRFLASGQYSMPAALGLTVGGLPAALVAAYVVKSLPLAALRWLVVLVVIYVSMSMLRSAATSGPALSAKIGPKVE